MLQVTLRMDFCVCRQFTIRVFKSFFLLASSLPMELRVRSPCSMSVLTAPYPCAQIHLLASLQHANGTIRIPGIHTRYLNPSQREFLSKLEFDVKAAHSFLQCLARSERVLHSNCLYAAWYPCNHKFSAT